jgi:hypothetical protein
MSQAESHVVHAASLPLHTATVGKRQASSLPYERALQAVNDRPWLWLTILTIVLAAQIRPWWFPQGDGMSFLSMARSLARDGQMRNMGSPHLWYFPGYSLLMTPLYFFGDHPFWLLSAFQWGSAILFMVGVYFWARQIVPEWAVWIAAIAVANQGVWIHCARTMSEVPFMCGLIWSANAARAFGRSRPWRQALPLGVLAATVLGLTALIRPAGILLAVGFGLSLGWQAFKRQTPWSRAIAMTLLLGLPGSAAVGGFLVADHAAAQSEHGRTYLSNFGDSAANPLASYLEGARMAIRDSGRVIIPGMFKAYQERGWRDLNLLIYFPVCAACALGWRRLLRGTIDPLLLMTPFYVLLYILYPYEAGARFYIPLLPVFAASFIPLIELLPSRRHLLVAGAFAAHLFLAAGYWLTADSARGRLAMTRWHELVPIAETIAQKPECIAANGVSGDDVFMLELMLDHRIPFAVSGPVPSTAEWMLTQLEAGKAPNFVRCAQTESLCLSRREAQTAPSSKDQLAGTMRLIRPTAE